MHRWFYFISGGDVIAHQGDKVYRVNLLELVSAVLKVYFDSDDIPADAHKVFDLLQEHKIQ